MSSSSSDKWFSAPRARCSANLLLSSSRDTGSPEAARRRVNLRDRLGADAPRL
ncbi:hypothetical protein BC834DRAFT_832643 [Gloeopeniophorella convolvens]|nr:hypothetical protein BC834DRAFT_832643 [Gloeopeniophorella convolvens]